jgi:hypothetical protein
MCPDVVLATATTANVNLGSVSPHPGVRFGTHQIQRGRRPTFRRLPLSQGVGLLLDLGNFHQLRDLLHYSL